MAARPVTSAAMGDLARAVADLARAVARQGSPADVAHAVADQSDAVMADLARAVARQGSPGMAGSALVVAVGEAAGAGLRDCLGTAGTPSAWATARASWQSRASWAHCPPLVSAVVAPSPGAGPAWSPRRKRTHCRGKPPASGLQ